MARSSQVRSIDRRAGVSMAEVVMDDMTIGNPASPVAQLWRFRALFPGIHIAQFPEQVIGNCGVNLLMQCSIRGQGKNLSSGGGGGAGRRPDTGSRCPARPVVRLAQ